MDAPEREKEIEDLEAEAKVHRAELVKIYTAFETRAIFTGDLTAAQQWADKAKAQGESE